MSKTTGAERPVALRVLFLKIPKALQDLAQWVVWSYVRDVDPETGEISWDKPPRQCGRIAPASSTDPSTWGDWDGAMRACSDLGFDGAGFVLWFKKDATVRIIAIDLDNCRNPETGIIEQWALDIVHRINSYTEFSPSGRGLRIFLYGALPPHGKLNGRKNGNVEMYEAGRYVTVTGHHIPGTPANIEHRQEEMLAVYNEHFSKKDETVRNPCPAADVDLDDGELLERARKAKNGDRLRKLLNGDFSDYKSRSEGELAACNDLAFWFGRNADRMYRVICNSGLWRSKWKRQDYRDSTLGKAIAGCRNIYEPGPRHSFSYTHTSNGAQTNGHTSNGAADETAKQSFQLTDLGNAKRVVARHGQNWRHCHPWKKSLTFDDKRWKEDETAATTRYVKETQASLFQWAAEQIKEIGDPGDDEDAKAQLVAMKNLLSHCLKWQHVNRISASVQLAVSEPGIPVLPEELDRDPWLLNVENGTVDLRTGELRPHRREDLLTKLAPVAYDLHAACPLWEQCLRRWMNGNERLVTYLQRAVGYSLTGSVNEQIMFFLFGSGANGKSTFLLTLLDLLGDYAIQTVSDLLMTKNSEAHPTERADLFGRRFAATIETEEGKRMAEALTKQLTGGDKVKARRMRQDFFEFKPTWKIWLAANHHPRIRGTDHAIWRRIKLIPFTVTIPEKEKDKALAEKLKAEAAGILAWAVVGCLEWQREGMAEPDEVRTATNEYRQQQDVLQGFFDECCIINPSAKIRTSCLYEAYQNWSGDRVMTQPEFRKQMTDRGFQSVRSTGGNWFYHGVGLPNESKNTYASDGG